VAQPAEDPAGPDRSALATGMSIGEVLDLLRREFPDVSVSKLRFLDAEGLIAPARTPSGYRRFTGEDVDRLRWVLRVQRDHYLPLRVIKGHLDAAGVVGAPETMPGVDAVSGLAPVPAEAPGRPEAAGRADGRPEAAGLPEAGPGADPVPRPVRPPRGRRLHRDELYDLTGITPQTLVEMESYGLVRARSGWYDPDDVVVAHTVARLAAYGLGPRHLRGLRAAADREVGLLEQVVIPQLRHRRPDARARAEQSAAELRELTRRLHEALVSGALRDLGLDPH